MNSKLSSTGKSPEQLYRDKSFIIRRLASGIYIEFVKYWNWDADTLKKHPEFTQYDIACLCINRFGVECFGSLNNYIDNKRFYFRFCNIPEIRQIKDLHPIFNDKNLNNTEAQNLINSVLYAN